MAEYDLKVGDSFGDRVAFRVMHWLLSPGGSDMARLRGYLRLKEWRDCRSMRERVHTAKRALKLPARAIRDSRIAMRKHGEAATRSGVSPASQLAHLVWLWMRHGMHPEVYYAFKLYNQRHLHRAPNFFQDDEDDRLFRLLNTRIARDEAELLVDKLAFEKWLVARGFPTIRTAMVLSNGAVIDSTTSGNGLPRSDLFVKPKDSLQGIGTQQWALDGLGWRGSDGVCGEEELMRLLCESSLKQPILVQEKVRNHPLLSALAVNTLSTVRVLTLRGLDGGLSVLLAVCKIPTGHATTDHMRLGGIAAQVDVETGRLGVGVGKAEKGLIEYRTTHPDTGVQLEGFQLPMWNETRELALRAHGALSDLVCIGWDIAITADGPVIVEGNDNPGHTSSQMPTGIALGETSIPSVLLSRLEASFGRRGSPAIR